MVRDEEHRLLNFLVQVYFNRITSSKEDTTSAIYSFLSGLANSKREEYTVSKQKKAIIDSFFEIVGQPEVNDAIRTRKLTKEEFIEKYQERILGDNKRKYSMSDLYFLKKQYLYQLGKK